MASLCVGLLVNAYIDGRFLDQVPAVIVVMIYATMFHLGIKSGLSGNGAHTTFDQEFSPRANLFDDDHIGPRFNTNGLPMNGYVDSMGNPPGATSWSNDSLITSSSSSHDSWRS